MKVNPNLLKAIALGLTISTIASSCQKRVANTGGTKIDKPKQNNPQEPCPKCGMG